MIAPAAEILSATALPGRFGVEIDVDLAQPLDGSQQVALRSLVHEHGLVIARAQQLDAAQHTRLVEYLGPVPTQGHDGVSMLSNTVADGTAGFAAEFASGALAFHSDDAFSPDPTRYISLHAVDVVDGASSTIFASAACALDDLPAGLRARIDPLEALHVFGRYVGRRNRLRTSETNDPHSFHPVVWRHPVTGQRLLYVNYLMTDSLYGLALAESDRLLEQLFDHLYAPINVHEHFWRRGDLLLWDNFLLQHARGTVDETRVGLRKLSRVISVNKGFFEAHPQFLTEFMAS